MAGLAAQYNLPKIPGMTFGEEMLRTNFHKSQTMNTRTGVSASKPVSAATEEFDTLALQNRLQASGTLNANGTVGASQKKVSLDRKVLRFQAFFKEGVHESPLEQQRVRKCLILYFLEDDTLAVSEPKQDNSGIAGQGSLVKRHQVPRPGGGIWSFENLNIGIDVEIYGKTFHLIDCDAFTRRFLESLDVHVPEPESFPSDMYAQARDAAAMKPKKGAGKLDSGTQRTKLSSEEIVKTKQFLAHDKKVLRFFCVWDDRQNLYGDIRLFTLQYFLSDDTIEVTETNPPNCGRDPFPSFVKRKRIPKAKNGQFYNPNASLSFKTEAVEYLADRDLMIGERLNVYGRELLVYDVDEFTQQHLREQYGITDFTPINIKQPGAPKVVAEPPPYNGFGDEEDSLGSWKHLVMKGPRVDVRKYMENSDKQLKFELRMVGGTDPTNAIRKFVLTYFLADDTISVFEPAQRNSGIIGGKFLNRQKVKKVGADGLPTGSYLRPDDLYVGAKVVVNTHLFQVASTDERSLNFMESKPEQFKKSDINAILSKLRAMMIAGGMKQAFEQADRDGSGALDFREFANVVEQLHLPLTEQELLTVMRYFDKSGDGTISWSEFVSTIVPPDYEATQANSSLKDRNWEEIRLLAEQLEQDEVDKFKQDMSGTVQRVNEITDAAQRQFLEKYNQRRALFNSTFKTVADNSPDSNIGEAEFRRAVQMRLKLGVPEGQMKAIVARFFPPSLPRVPYNEFIRMLNGTSTHTHMARR